MDSLVALQVWLMLIAAPCVACFVLGEMRGWNRASALFAVDHQTKVSTVFGNQASPNIAKTRARDPSLPPAFAFQKSCAAQSENLADEVSQEDAATMLRDYRRAVLALRAQLPSHENVGLTLYPPTNEDSFDGPRISDLAPLSPHMRAAHMTLRRQNSAHVPSDQVPTVVMEPFG